MKIKTGLPYSSDDMNFISYNGAIIDMHHLRFTSNPYKTKQFLALLYLKNTRFLNNNLIFSKCSYDEKYNYLIKYIEQKDLEFKSIELIKTWYQIFNFYLNNYIQMESILYFKQMQRFISENSTKISQYCKIVSDYQQNIDNESINTLNSNIQYFKEFQSLKTICNLYKNFEGLNKLS